MKRRDRAPKEQPKEVVQTPPTFVEKESVYVWNRRFFESLFDEVDSSNLALFRIGFSIAFGWHLFSIWNQGMIPAFFWFSNLFRWVTTTSIPFINLLLWTNIFACIAFGIGFKHKAVTVINLLCYTYIFLLEKAWYVNHHYLFILVLFLFFWVDASSTYAWDTRNVIYERRIRRWQIYLFRVLLVIVYFWAGIAKCQEDWLLRGEPLYTWFFRGSPFWKSPMIGFTTKIFPESIISFASIAGSYFGIFVDLICGPLLLFHWTRYLALFFQVSFHVMNHNIFTIGSFPLMMLGTTFLWIPSEYCRSFAKRVRIEPKERIVPEEDLAEPEEAEKRKKAKPTNMNAFNMLTIFLAIQMVLPLKPYLVTNDPNWTNVGHFFSWRMMLNQEDALIRWMARDVDDKSSEPTYYTFYSAMPVAQLTDYQRFQMRHHADMIQEFAVKFVEPYCIQRLNMTHPVVDVEAWRSVNYRPFQRWIRQDIDLLTVSYNPFIGFGDWFIPRIEDVNSYEWMSHLKNIRLDWQVKHGFDVAFFADTPGKSWEATFRPFAKELFLVLLKGEVLLEIDGSPNEDMELNKIYSIPFDTYHALTNTGSESSCWLYAWKGQKYNFAKALLMD